MPLSEAIIEASVERYWREYDRYAKLAELVGDECQRLLSENAIRGSIQWRAKNPERLKGKLQREMKDPQRAGLYTDTESVFSVLRDFAGVRITTYVESDRASIVERVKNVFDGFGPTGEVMATIKDSNDNQYRATHCIVKVKESFLVGKYVNLRGVVCEIQVCSLLAHVYNEIEHDIRYKPFTGILTDNENTLLDSLGGHMKVGDTLVQQILNAVAERQKASNSPFSDVYDFVSRVRGLFPSATSFPNNAGQLYEACMKLDLDNVEKLKAALKWNDDTTEQHGAQLVEDFAADVNQGSEVELPVDPSSSDQLLVLLLEDSDRIQQLRQHYPAGYGKGRPRRLIVLANRFDEWLNLE